MNTAHPIDTEALSRRAGHVLFTEGPEQPAATAREVCVLLDLLAASEARAIRAEAQSEARRVNAAYWKERARIMGRKRDAGVRELADVQTERNNALTRIKAVQDVLDRFAIDGHDQLVHGQVIRRALGNDHPPHA